MTGSLSDRTARRAPLRPRPTDPRAIARRVALGAASRIRVGCLDASSCPTARGASSVIAALRLRGEMRFHDQRAARPHPAPRRDRRRRGLHGRRLDQPRPAGAPRDGGAEPRSARAVGRLVARARATAAARWPIAPDATRAGRRAATSPRTTTSQRPLPAVPGRDAHLLVGRVRDARPVAGRRAAQQVPAHRRRRRPAGGHARPRDRLGLGRVRALRGRRTRLSRHDDHDLAGAARPGARAGPRGRAGRTRRRRSCATTARSRRVRRDHLDRDARGGRARSTTRVLRAGDRRACAGRPAQPPDDHLPPRRVRGAAPRGELDPAVHLPGRPRCPRWRRSSRPPPALACCSGAPATSPTTTC